MATLKICKKKNTVLLQNEFKTNSYYELYLQQEQISHFMREKTEAKCDFI